RTAGNAPMWVSSDSRHDFGTRRGGDATRVWPRMQRTAQCQCGSLRPSSRRTTVTNSVIAGMFRHQTAAVRQPGGGGLAVFYSRALIVGADGLSLNPLNTAVSVNPSAVCWSCCLPVEVLYVPFALTLMVSLPSATKTLAPASTAFSTPT